MKSARQQLDAWIREEFPRINTDLENAYRKARKSEAPASDEEAGEVEGLKERLLELGQRHLQSVLRESPLSGNFDDRLELLGDVGMFISACTRHGLNERPAQPGSPLVEASRLALQLGLALGVAPRLILASYATRNKAGKGSFKSFTLFQEERLFIDYNTRSIFEYERAAEALLKIFHLGISNPISFEFLNEARIGLERVAENNDALFSELDVGVFFNAIRPYYLPAFVGEKTYRGVNAGDFAGINQVDLLLGLCSANDPFYLGLLSEKIPFVLPHEQEAIRESLVQKSLLDEFLDAARSCSRDDWFRRNAEAFLSVCRTHGRGAAAHHNKLVERFIVRPARHLPPERRSRLTASGPPLEVLLETLERLRDLRLAKDRQGIHSRHRDIQFLKRLVEQDRQAKEAS